MKKVHFKVEEIVFVVAAGFSALVSLLDFSGILGSIPWLSERVPTLTLLLLSILTGYLVIERRSRLEELESLPRSGTENILREIVQGKAEIFNLISDGNALLFNNPEETYTYFIERLSKAQYSIDVTHFGGRPYRKGQDNYFGRASYYELLSRIVKEGKVKVRRIQLIRDLDGLEWVREVLDEFAQHRFYLGCYVGNASDIPLLSLIVIDGEEVCLACAEKNFSFDQKTISIKNPIFTKLIQSYIDILWRNALVVKEREVDYVLLNSIEKTIKG
jgi:hypothetical protein